MLNLFFPLLATLAVFLLFIPFVTFIAAFLLKILPIGSSIVYAYAHPLRFALLISPVALPGTWMISTIIHETRNGRPLGDCLIEHAGSNLCVDLIMFGGILAAILLYHFFSSMRNSKPQQVVFSQKRCKENQLLNVLIAREDNLRVNRHRICCIIEGEALIYTHGLLNPQILINISLIRLLTEDEIIAVLLHELVHLKSRDPLRIFLASSLFGLNPLRRIISQDISKYFFAKEALADLKAVILGARPLDLASGIIKTAKVRLPKEEGQYTISALDGAGIGGLDLRIKLLMDYSRKKPQDQSTRLANGLFVILFLAIVFWPHLRENNIFKLFHQQIELFALTLSL